VSLHRRFAALILSGALLVLSGCGSDGAAETPAPTGTDAGAQTSPTANGTAGGAGNPQTAALGGTPATEATVGQPYSFVAQLQTTGSGFAYTIQNKPSWASFDTASGKLSGTPAAAHLGNHPGIVITASNGAISATLAPFAIAVVQPRTATQSVTLSWIPPTQNTDGSSLSDLNGYYVYHGTSPDSMERKHQITNPGLTAYTVGELQAGTHYFSISAYTVSGVEGGMSGVASKTIM
jgi:hypothetical protein